MSDLKTVLSEAVAAAFAAEGVEPALARVTPSDRPDLADFQSNGALAAAKALKANPRELAGKIAERLGADARFASVEVAGPGFINLKIADAVLAERAAEVAADADARVFNQISKDFAAAGVDQSEHQIRRTMDEMLAKAKAEIQAGK